MTELAFPWDELNDRQDFKKLGPKLWRKGKLRIGGRVALHGVQDTPNVSVVLNRLRKAINADPSVLKDPAEPLQEADPMAAALPPVEILRSIGISACELSSQHLGGTRKN
jgi:hypothetical protein